MQQDSRTVGLLLLREIKTCAYIFLLSAAYSSYSSIKYTIRSVTTVSFPCCCCCTTRRSEAFHNLKLPNPHFLYLLSFTSAHINLKFLTFHIIHVDKFGLCLYFTCHYAVHSRFKLDITSEHQTSEYFNPLYSLHNEL